MRDCANGWGEAGGEGDAGLGAVREPRDLLPDLVADEAEGGGRLSWADRARLLAHVATCDACRAELELLQSARRAVWAATPAANVASIVRALPSRAVAAAARPRPSAHRFAWRIAAVVSTIAVGGLSVAVLQDAGRHGTRVASSSVAPASAPASTPASPPAPATTPIAPAGIATPGSAAQPPVSHAAPLPAPSAAVGGGGGGGGGGGAGLELSARLGDLSDSQLNQLLSDIDNLDAVPDAEPDQAGPALADEGHTL